MPDADTRCPTTELCECACMACSFDLGCTRPTCNRAAHAEAPA